MLLNRSTWWNLENTVYWNIECLYNLVDDLITFDIKLDSNICEEAVSRPNSPIEHFKESRGLNEFSLPMLAIPML